MKYNEAHATTMLNALIGTETLKKHDSDLLDKVLERVKEHHYLLSDQINSTDYGMFTVGIEQVIAEMKSEIDEE